MPLPYQAFPLINSSSAASNCAVPQSSVGSCLQSPEEPASTQASWALLCPHPNQHTVCATFVGTALSYLALQSHPLFTQTLLTQRPQRAPALINSSGEGHIVVIPIPVFRVVLKDNTSPIKASNRILQPIS